MPAQVHVLNASGRQKLTDASVNSAQSLERYACRRSRRIRSARTSSRISRSSAAIFARSSGVHVFFFAIVVLPEPKQLIQLELHSRTLIRTGARHLKVPGTACEPCAKLAQAGCYGGGIGAGTGS